MLESAKTGVEVDLADRANFRYESAKVAGRCVALSSRMLRTSGSGSIRNKSSLLAKHLYMLASQAHVANVSDSF
jgi:3-hydroxy-9,10-secoandrosta-1,3,5(10)-triene-9,17-dione monooxygenase